MISELVLRVDPVFLGDYNLHYSHKIRLTFMTCSVIAKLSLLVLAAKKQHLKGLSESITQEKNWMNAEMIEMCEQLGTFFIVTGVELFLV